MFIILSQKNCIAIAILKLVAEMRSGAYLTYVSILNSSQMPKEHYQTKKLHSNSYFEAGRRDEKRSILDVCEHSQLKPDAKRALPNKKIA